MIKNIVLALCGFVAVALLILWMLNGGPRRMYEGARNFSISGTTTIGFALPWQPDNLIPQINDEISLGANGIQTGTEAELSDLEREYENVEAEAKRIANMGNPSPLFEKVQIMPGSSDPRSTSLSEERVVLTADYGNTSPISLAGWSLQSAYTGNYIPIEGGASPFWMGAVNTLAPISLAPGDTVYVTSGVSPVGISFRENICTGYLSQFQTFSPSLRLQCPTPREEVPLTEENLRAYGEECIDALDYIPTCEFPKDITNVSPACRTHLQTTLSYNGCVGRHASDANFAEGVWRVYAGSKQELWRNVHDALRLLDEKGRVVDVYVY